MVCGRYKVFEVEVHAEDIWRLEPLGSGSFPDVHWSRIAFPRGDIKYTWEIGRCYHVSLLARAWLATNDRRYLEVLRDQWRQLLTALQVGRGVHFTSGLECAVRCVNLLFSLQVSGDALDELRDEALQHLAHTFDFIWDHIGFSRWWVPNDHLLGELAAVYIGCRCLGRHSARGHRAWQALQHEVQSQFSEDGVYGNHSVFYQRFALEWILLALRVANLAGDPSSSAMRQRIAAATNFIAALCGSGGHVFRYGDDDGGHLLGIDEGLYHDFRPLLTALADLGFGPRPIHRSGELAFWLTGPNTSRVESAAPPPRPRVERSSCGLLARMGQAELFLRCGEQTGPRRMVFGHADQLHVGLRLAGEPILVDAGTYRYNGVSRWRQHFAGTRAHNTVMLGGADQLERLTTFLWAGRCRGEESPGLEARDVVVLQGTHDGYRRLRARHWRLVALLRGYGLVLVDRIRVGAPLVVESRLHFAPSFNLAPASRDYGTTARGFDHTIEVDHWATSPLQVNIARGAEDPLEGWYSPGYGLLQPNAVEICSTRAEDLAVLVTTLSWSTKRVLTRLPQLDAVRLRLPTARGMLQARWTTLGYQVQLLKLTANED